MPKVCFAEWCIFEAAPGSKWCAAHVKEPPLHNLETADQWRSRTSRERAARKRAADKAAKSDAALAAKRGR